MSNIFLIIDKIKALLDNKALILSERVFLEQLLHGNEYQLGLIKLAQHATPGSFKILEQEVLTHLSSIAPCKRSYRFSIKSIYKDIVLFRRLTEDIAKSQSMATPTKAFAQYAILRDKIYLATCNQYNGVIMLPILQCMDYRLGNSKGECSGYVAEWVESFLNDKRPFGVCFLEEPPFQPISLNSNIGKQYPELNHCAPLTKNIAHLQKLNFRFTTKGLDHTTKGTIYQQNEGGVVFKHDASLLAQYLLNSSNRNPNCGFYLSLRNNTNGHALGFYKDKEKKYSIVGEAENGLELVSMAKETSPDIILTDKNYHFQTYT